MGKPDDLPALTVQGCLERGGVGVLGGVLRGEGAEYDGGGRLVEGFAGDGVAHGRGDVCEAGGGLFDGRAHLGQGSEGGGVLGVGDIGLLQERRDWVDVILCATGSLLGAEAASAGGDGALEVAMYGGDFSGGGPVLFAADQFRFLVGEAIEAWQNFGAAAHERVQPLVERDMRLLKNGSGPHCEPDPTPSAMVTALALALRHTPATTVRAAHAILPPDLLDILPRIVLVGKPLKEGENTDDAFLLNSCWQVTSPLK